MSSNTEGDKGDNIAERFHSLNLADSQDSDDEPANLEPKPTSNIVITEITEETDSDSDGTGDGYIDFEDIRARPPPGFGQTFMGTGEMNQWGSHVHVVPQSQRDGFEAGFGKFPHHGHNNHMHNHHHEMGPHPTRGSNFGPEFQSRIGPNFSSNFRGFGGENDSDDEEMRMPRSDPRFGMGFGMGMTGPAGFPFSQHRFDPHQRPTTDDSDGPPMNFQSLMQAKEDLELKRAIQRSIEDFEKEEEKRKEAEKLAKFQEDVRKNYEEGLAKKKEKEGLEKVNVLPVETEVEDDEANFFYDENEGEEGEGEGEEPEIEDTNNDEYNSDEE